MDLGTALKDAGARSSHHTRTSAGLTGEKVAEGSHFKADEMVAQNWHVRKVLGKTHLSEVQLCVHRQSGATKALKVIDKQAVLQYLGRRGSRTSLTSEAELLHSLQHPNIVQLDEWFETASSLYLVMEYVPGGDLFGCITKYGYFSEVEASRLFSEICAAVGYLHSLGIVHRDIKLENILLTAGDRSVAHPKVSDFGISRRSHCSRDCRTFCGSLNYTAPEVVNLRPMRLDAFQRSSIALGARRLSTECASIVDEPGPHGYGKPADVWSLGVVLYIMLCGSPPFDDDGEESLCIQIVQGSWAFDVDAWVDVSVEAKGLVRGLMALCPRERMTIEQVRDHRWLGA